MRAWPALLLVATGCRALLGIDEARVGDAAQSDAALDAPAEATTDVCYGAGLVRVCVPAPPTGGRILAAAIDTDTMCDFVQDNLCVIAADKLSIPTGSTRVTGMRPLVLVAGDVLEVLGTLDGASQRTAGKGPAANAASCGVAQAGENDGGGGGGGAGGSFYGRGGSGGEGDTNQNGLPNGSATGGIAAPVTTTQTLRGGCPGGMGGQGSGPSGAPGAGGGALYLIAGASIEVSGAVNAGGAGGTGGSVTVGGGGGGGSGGMIGFDAPQITITGIAAANGAGGGEGGAQQPGNSGVDGALSQSPASGGSGGVIDAGDGGSGSGGTAPNGTNAGSGAGGGGGGGGGAGVIYVKGTLTAPGVVSPPPN